MKKLLLASTLLLAALVHVPGAHAQAPATLAGAWDYKLDTGQGEMGGTITLTDSSGALGGTIASSDGQVLSLEHVALAGDTLSFGFTSGQYGAGTGRLAFAGETFKGMLSLPSYGRFPLRGTRKPAESAAAVAPETAPAPEVTTPRPVLNTRTLLQDLFQNEQAKAVLEKHVPGLTTNPQIDQAMGMSLRDIAPYAPDTFTEKVLQAIDEDLSKL
jgi:hypothetical protein